VGKSCDRSSGGQEPKAIGQYEPNFQWTAINKKISKTILGKIKNTSGEVSNPRLGCIRHHDGKLSGDDYLDGVRKC
jgi:hypothetical protein